MLVDVCHLLSLSCTLTTGMLVDFLLMSILDLYSHNRACGGRVCRVPSLPCTQPTGMLVDLVVDFYP
eukprot:12886566-Prorocentrum_lima.AAC.1